MSSKAVFQEYLSRVWFWLYVVMLLDFEEAKLRDDILSLVSRQKAIFA